MTKENTEVCKCLKCGSATSADINYVGEACSVICRVCFNNGPKRHNVIEAVGAWNEMCKPSDVLAYIPGPDSCHKL